MGGLIIAAPTSGAGKTTVTLGLLRALRDRTLGPVRAAKSGPDYIDPQFHAAATGHPSLNLDAWAMTPAQIQTYAAGPGLLLIEGAMGLFDGAPPDGRGAVADLARMLALPVVLVVDARRMSQSVTPLVAGFAGHDASVQIAGVILNNVGSARHEDMLRRALRPLNLEVLGAVRRDPQLALPSRHLGLVQAQEHADLEAFISMAGAQMAASVDLEALQALAAPLPAPQPVQPAPSTAKIAIARDAAFAFCYPHMLRDWQAAGAQVLPFSPLANDPVPDAATHVFLPGGYPELYAAQLAANTTFMQSLRNASHSIDIYGECGGYMLLGEQLIDAQGTAHDMAGLLPLVTSFETRKLHLGYRNLQSLSAAVPGNFYGHEFHYATTLRADGPPLFEAQDAEGAAMAPMGLMAKTPGGQVCGSFAHVIAGADVTAGPGLFTPRPGQSAV